MMHEMREQLKGLGTVDDSHTRRLELAGKMEKNWHALMLNRTDERAWAKLAPEELEEMRTKIAGWVQECERELEAHPSPEGTNNIIEDWKEGLARKSDEISKVIREQRKLRGEGAS